MFLIKNTFYVDCITNLYTKPVRNCGFIISDTTNELYNQPLGDFNLTSMESIGTFSFVQEKFILYVSEYDYVLLYNSLIKKVINNYNSLEQYVDVINLAKRIHVISDMNLSDHDDFVELSSLDLSNLHELSYEFLLPVLYITKPRIDRFIKEKLNNFLLSWKSYLHKKCYTKLINHLICIQSSQIDVLMQWRTFTDTHFNILLSACISWKQQEPELFGEIFNEILFLQKFDNNWDGLVDFLVSNNVRYIQSGNYKYNEYLISILSKAIIRNDSTCYTSTEQQTINGALTDQE